MKILAQTAFALALSVTPLAAIAANAIEPAAFEALPEMAAAEVTAQVSEKVLHAEMGGRQFRMDFRDSGYVYINAGGGSASRKWKVEGSNLCLIDRGESSCNRVRFDGTSLLLKTDAGEIVRYAQK